MRKEISLCLILCFMFSLALQAVPPHPKLMEKYEREGKIKRVNGRVVLPVYLRAPDVPRKNYRLQQDGKEYILAILVDFPDQPAQRSADELNRIIFSQNPTERSMYTYYLENSYGQMKVLPGPLEGVYPPDRWIRASRERRYYGANEGGALDAKIEELYREIIQRIDPQIDLAPYDRDNNGIIDHIMIINAGKGEEITGNPNDIHSCLATFVSLPLCDGKRIEHIICVSEEPGGDFPSLGVYCHEFAHSLGAPDLYAPPEIPEIVEPVEGWCLMSRGTYSNPPTHICGFLKYDLDANELNGIQGWLSPINLSEGRNTYEITALAKNSDPRLYRVKIASHHTDEGEVDEYFYLENRNRNGGTLFDTDLPDDGLVIWHVDYRGRGVYPPYLAWVERASPDYPVPLHAYHASPDPEMNHTAFTAETTPNSHRNDGQPSGVSITNISSAGPTMTFTFEFRNLSLEKIVREKKVDFSPYPNPFNPECYLPVGRMEREGGVKIYNILGQLVREIRCSGTQELKAGVYWDGRDEEGLEVPSGAYFYEIAGEGIRRMLMLR